MGKGERLRNCQKCFCELGSRGVTDKGSSRDRLFAGGRGSEGSELNRASYSVKGEEMTTENKFSEDKNESCTEADQRCLNGDCGDKMLTEDKRPLPTKIPRRTKSRKRRSEIEAQRNSDIAAGIQKSIDDSEYYERTCRSEGSE